MSLERSSPGCHLKARCFAVGGAMIAGLAALVVLNEHGGHGASAAVPAGMAVIEKYFELKRQDGGGAAAVAQADPQAAADVPPPSEVLALAHAPRARRPRPEDHSQARAAPPRR